MDLGENLNTVIEKIEDQGVKRKILSHLAHRITRPGSLGQLEEIALQIGLVQQRAMPVISQPCLYVFAGDHGITTEKVSANFKKRTSELVLEFLNEGAAINLFARQNGLSVRVVDVGIDHSFENTLSYWLHQGTSFFNRKIGPGTRFSGIPGHDYQ
ncbi:MAG: nicotinate-nucleotide--dimethylbenzimidazole phosphoribosyltransferase [Owenweeksia sp.]|nr:nicotinate-nucleotide--dimethylbenzimidazole phosphoribosyltransferase [Owenweeksia sp.]